NRTTPTAPSSAPTCNGRECTAARLGVFEASSEDGVNDPGPEPRKGADAQRLKASDHRVCRALLKLSLADNQAGQDSRLPSRITAIPAPAAPRHPSSTAIHCGGPFRLPTVNAMTNAIGRVRAMAA